MKLSAFHKINGNNVSHKLDYENLDLFDKVYISKVFTNTEIPHEPKDKTNKVYDKISDWYADNPILNQSNVEFGGTGFFYDKSPPLPPEIEHTKPDYDFYKEWVSSKIQAGEKLSNFRYYTDYSIGMTTRGCFRKCGFCVNKNCSKSIPHSPVNEFIDESRRKICLQDDNFLACSDWKRILQEIQSTKKSFQFKQGLDIKLLNQEKCSVLFSSRYDGEYIFAFDHADDYTLITKQIQLIRTFITKRIKFYVLCGWDESGSYNEEFWLDDIRSIFRRVGILGKYNCLPYITRFEKYITSPYRKIYVDIARWCNQPAFFTKLSFWEFCEKHGERSGTYQFAHSFMNTYDDFKSMFTKKNIS